MTRRDLFSDIRQDEIAIRSCETPLGPLVIKACDRGVFYANFVDDEALFDQVRASKLAASHADRAQDQFAAYFDGSLKVFSFEMDLRGTPFQLECWRALLKVPYGATASYGDIARAIGRPRAFRAVGGADHNNPIIIAVPCHRIIGSDGSLTGYGGGLWRKERLLEHEARYRDHTS